MQRGKASAPYGAVQICCGYGFPKLGVPLKKDVGDLYRAINRVDVCNYCWANSDTAFTWAPCDPSGQQSDPEQCRSLAAGASNGLGLESPLSR